MFLNLYYIIQAAYCNLYSFSTTDLAEDQCRRGWEGWDGVALPSAAVTFAQECRLGRIAHAYQLASKISESAPYQTQPQDPFVGIYACLAVLIRTTECSRSDLVAPNKEGKQIIAAVTPTCRATSELLSGPGRYSTL
jgi:hypothetical protein